MFHSFPIDIALLTIYFVLTLPDRAHAYLDPGSGNAIIIALISLTGAFFYALKGVFYKLTGKKDNQKTSGKRAAASRIVLFCEGRNYWYTFKPVVEALIVKGQPFAYYTMDIHDPALMIENDLIENRYIGKGSTAFAKMGRLKTDVLVATTPNIGTEGFPMARSADVRKLVHIWHSLGDFAYAWYHKGSLDHYDTILTVGNYMEPQIRLIEQKRKIPAKEVLTVGIPYLEVMAEELEARKPLLPTDGKTILIAPSWGNKNCLALYGDAFLHDLAQARYNVIIRPHPQSLKVETKMIDSMRTSLKEYPNVVWDFGVNGNPSMEKADLLISDVSSIRLDFAFLYKRPVITLEMPIPDLSEWEYDDLQELLEKSTMNNDLGATVSQSNVKDIVWIVEKTLKDSRTRDYAAMRRKYIANFHHSGARIADYLIAQLDAK